MQNILLLKARKKVTVNDYVTDQFTLPLGGGGQIVWFAEKVSTAM